MSDEIPTLDGDGLDEAVAGLAGWQVDGDAISKKYVFGDFCQAFAFMTRCALEAERRGHHPDWRNVYKTVFVTLSTHEAGGVTSRDLELAQAFDRAASG